MRAKLIPIIACALAAMTFQQCSTNKSADEFIQKPFTNIDIKGNTFELDASEARTFTLANGTSIAIPANAFVDEDNNPVKGKVKIDYREFHNAADIIASGIPMTYDSAGQRMHFETAGMFEIQGATIDNKPVYVAPGKKLNVNLASFNKDDNFNNYFLNPTTRNWDFTETVVPRPNEVKQAKLKELGETPSKPVMPEKYDGSSLVFDLDLNYKHYPELKEFNGIVWQYAGTDPKMDPAKNPAIFQQSWTKIELRANNDEYSTFDLILSNSSKSFTTTVKPVLKGKNYEKAMAKFKERIGKYQVAMLAREKEEERLKTEADLMRSFNVSGFGIYNCDRIYKRPDNIIVQARLMLEGVEDKNAGHIKIYHVAANDKAVIALNGLNPTLAISLSEKDNKLVAVLPGNQLAVCPSGEFEALNLTGAETVNTTPIFHLKKINKELKSVEDIQKVLESL